MFLGVGNFFSEQTKIFLKPANSHLFLSHARKPGEEPLVAFDLKVKLFSIFFASSHRSFLVSLFSKCRSVYKYFGV